MGLEFRVLRKANEIAAFKVVLLGARLCGAPSFEVRHQASRSAFRFTVSTRHDWHLSVATDIMVFTICTNQRQTGRPSQCQSSRLIPQTTRQVRLHSAGFWNGRGPRPEPIRSISRCRWRPSVLTAGLRINPKTLSSSTPMEQTYPGRRTALLDDFSLAAN